MAERSIAAVLKTVDPQGSGGSNPSPSANRGDIERSPRSAMRDAGSVHRPGGRAAPPRYSQRSSGDGGTGAAAGADADG